MSYARTGRAPLDENEAWLIDERRSSGERKYYLANLPIDTPIKALAGWSAPAPIACLNGRRNRPRTGVANAIVAFLGDEGGKPLLRLGYMLIGPSALVAGAAVGSVVGANGVFVAITVLLGLFYGLVEGPQLLLSPGSPATVSCLDSRWRGSTLPTRSP